MEKQTLGKEGVCEMCTQNKTKPASSENWSLGFLHFQQLFPYLGFQFAF